MTVLIDRTDNEDVRRICEAHGARPDALLEILHEIQTACGWLSDDALRTVAHALNLSRAEIHGVVSFYHDYRRAPPPRLVVKICRAEACQAVGSEALAAHAGALLSDDPEAAVEAVYCLGNCALGPAIMIDGALYGRVDADRFDRICRKHLDGEAQGS